MDYIIVNGELYHHGVKGQKWGVRRFQNADGSLTTAGKKRYFRKSNADILAKDLSKAQKKLDNAKTEKAKTRAQKKVDRLSKADPNAYATLKKNQRKEVAKLAALGGLKVYAYAKSPKGQATIAKGKKAVQTIIDKKYNASILDANGKVLRRFNM